MEFIEIQGFNQQHGFTCTERLGEPPTFGTSTTHWAQQFHFRPVTTNKHSVAKKLGCSGDRTNKLGMKPDDAVGTSFLQGVLIHQRTPAFAQRVFNSVDSWWLPWKRVGCFGLDSGFTTPPGYAPIQSQQTCQRSPFKRDA